MIFITMRKAVAHLLPKIEAHPFNQALYQGTLPRAAFRFYLEQDALYLHDFSKALRLTSERFTNEQYAKQFKNFSEEIQNTELNLHYKYLGERRNPSFFQLNKAPIKKISVISDYTEYLLNKARTSPIEEAVASLVPCYWIYHELGKRMSYTPINNPYHTWIKSYSNAQFSLATQEIIQIAQTLGQAMPCPRQQEKMVSAFVQSIEFEILFWDSVEFELHEPCSTYSKR